MFSDYATLKEAFLAAAAGLEARRRGGEDVCLYARGGAVLLYDRSRGFVARYAYSEETPFPSVPVVVRDGAGHDVIVTARYDADAQCWRPAGGEAAVPREEGCPIGIVAPVEDDDFDPSAVMRRITLRKTDFGIIDVNNDGDALSLTFLCEDDARCFANTILSTLDEHHDGLAR